MKEGNVLFNDALNTFYLRLYGVRHMVKDHSDSERGNPLPAHRLLFPISSKGSLYASSHRRDNTYHGLYYTSRGALAGKRNSSMCPPWRIDPTIHRTMSERSYHGHTSCSLLTWWSIRVAVVLLCLLCFDYIFFAIYLFIYLFIYLTVSDAQSVWFLTASHCSLWVCFPLCAQHSKNVLSVSLNNVIN